MYYEAAKWNADMYTDETGDEAYVYYDEVEGSFGWCGADDFFYVWSEMVYDIVVVYSTIGGRYG